MPATVRYDEQYCPVARALDVLGDRWTLLVLREVLAGQERFNDIRANLPGVAPGVLTARIRTLVDEDLIAAEGSESRPRYVITERGKEALPVMRALARFGMPILEAPAKGRATRPWSAVQTCLVAYYSPTDSKGIKESYLLRISGEEFTLTSRGTLELAQPSVLLVETSAATLFRIRKELISLHDAIEKGEVVVYGPKAALKRFSQVFGLR
jgi:DNA-binding HxlR family transcriptional regulator